MFSDNSSTDSINQTNTTKISPEIIILTLGNPAFCVYLICASLLILKMMAVALFTVYNRFSTKIFISEEDAKWRNGEMAKNDKIERIRRAHLNDVENILMFLIISLGYLWTEPAVWFYSLQLIVFTVARYLHSFVYAIYVVPQPTRASLWTIGLAITGYQCAHTGIYAFIHLL